MNGDAGGYDMDEKRKMGAGKRGSTDLEAGSFGNGGMKMDLGLDRVSRL